jgi:hypothetical protein
MRQIRQVAVVGDGGQRRARHLVDQGAQALIHDGVEQLVTRLEVVVHHRRRHPGLAGDRRQRGRADAVARKQLHGNVEQTVA